MNSCTEEDTPHVIALSEVKPKNQAKPLELQCYSLKDYSMESTITDTAQGRGLLLYLRKDLDYSITDFAQQVAEVQVADIMLGQNKKISLASIYRSPNSSRENNQMINLFVKDLAQRNEHTIITGDLNYPHIDWTNMTTTGTQTDSEFHFIEAVRDAFMVQHVDQVTRARGTNRPSLLDLVLTDETQPAPDIEFCSPLGKSDHCLIKASFHVNYLQATFFKQRLNVNRGNYVRMKQVLDINWIEVMERESTAESKWAKFRDTITEAADRCIPKMKIRRGHTKKIPIDRKTLSKMRKKKRLWKEYNRTGDQDVYQEYCRARNQLRGLTRKNIRDKEKDIASQVKQNPKKFWAYVSQKTKFRNEIPQLMKSNGTDTADDEEKAQEFSRYFASVFLDEPDGHWELPESRFPEMNQEIIFSRTTVLNELNNIDGTKSPGPDGLHPRILHEMSDIIALPLSMIFQASYQEGRLPPDWKIANIVAIHKKGNKKFVNNYRPVSLTSVCCKIMERIIRRQIMNHLKNEDILSKQQYGFVSGRSTLLQLLRVLDKWTESLDTGKEVDVVFLDFQKAFDSVPHNRLLDKLAHYGIKGTALEWISSFLIGRSQQVKIHNATSQREVVRSGVPQGSVLGPALFVIFINSLPDVVTPSTQIFLFADDAKMFRQITNQEDQDRLQIDLDNLHRWTTKSLLRFNSDKCACMTLTRRRTDDERQYFMNGKSLRHSQAERDLGVIIDQKLSFDEHIAAKIKKANSMASLIRRTYTYLDEKTFLLLYKSLVRPHLEYCNQIWRPYLRKHIAAIENVQRRATRMIPGMSGLTYEERLTKLKLPTLEYRRMRGDMIETYKILSGKYDSAITEGLFTINNRISRGHNLKLEVHRPNTNMRKNTFTFRCVNKWNQLPEEVITAPSVRSFENKLDKYWRRVGVNAFEPPYAQ